MPRSVARQLDWAVGARSHLIEIETYIETESPAAARSVIDHILTSAEQLTQFPFTGKIGRLHGVRELVLTRFPYTIFYRVKPAKIQIVRVLHQRRKFP